MRKRLKGQAQELDPEVEKKLAAALKEDERRRAELKVSLCHTAHPLCCTVRCCDVHRSCRPRRSGTRASIVTRFRINGGS